MNNIEHGPIVVYVGGEAFVRYERVRMKVSFEVHCTQCNWKETIDKRPHTPFQFQRHAQHCVDDHLPWIRRITQQAQALGVAVFAPGSGFHWRNEPAGAVPAQRSTAAPPQEMAEVGPLREAIDG